MPNQDAVEPVAIPRGVADPAGETGYVMTSAAGIDAVDLASGRRRWSTSAASWPLLVDEGRLIAYRAAGEPPNAIRVVVLDADGTTLLTTDAVTLPPWFSVAEARRDDFRVEARVEARTLVLGWRAASRYRGGAPPPEAVVQQATHDVEGTARVDLESGKVEASEGWRRQMRASGSSVARPSAAYQVGFAWHETAWTVGDQMAALEVDASASRPSLYLRVWPRASGGEGERHLLFEGEPVSSAVTPDGRYLFVQRADEPPSGGFTWWCFDVESARLVVTFEHEAGAQAPAVAGSRVLYLVSVGGPAPRADYVARDLTTGELLWRRALESKPPSRRPPRMAAGPFPGGPRR